MLFPKLITFKLPSKRFIKPIKWQSGFDLLFEIAIFQKIKMIKFSHHFFRVTADFVLFSLNDLINGVSPGEYFLVAVLRLIFNLKS